MRLTRSRSRLGLAMNLFLGRLESFRPHELRSLRGIVARHVPAAREDQLPAAGERADDRHETGQDDRLAAVSCVELFALQEMIASEQQGIGPAVERLSGPQAHPVSGGIADDR